MTFFYICIYIIRYALAPGVVLIVSDLADSQDNDDGFP